MHLISNTNVPMCNSCSMKLVLSRPLPINMSYGRNCTLRLEKALHNSKSPMALLDNCSVSNTLILKYRHCSCRLKSTSNPSMYKVIWQHQSFQWKHYSVRTFLLSAVYHCALQLRTCYTLEYFYRNQKSAETVFSVFQMAPPFCHSTPSN